jgi:AcrR family transcriptional regulator
MYEEDLMHTDGHDGGMGRTNQRIRTRTAIIAACRRLIQAGAVITMPEVARLALVSEATAYRYFPDLVSLINEALAGLWPNPAEAFQPIANATDPRERIAFAVEFFLQRILVYQGSVRAAISATITRAEDAATRPGLRFVWIDYALEPATALMHADALAQLKRDLAVVVSPEALFNLTDLCGLSPDEAIKSLVRLATAITALAMQGE